MSISRTVQICNRRGLHARASAKFVTMASGLSAQVEVEKEGTRVVGTSIMGLMMLGAALGDEITIHGSGDGAEQAVNALAELVEARFHEAE
ncbi:MAG: HPr family phosphocarrier protein [Sphingomonadaceae bacterium]|mgnify:CR=1 FL=1|jgi:phosphocarrier protein HPr